MYLVNMYVRGRLEQQGRRQTKSRTQQATGDKEVQKAEGDQDCCAKSQARLISQFLYSCNNWFGDKRQLYTTNAYNQH